MKARSPVGAEGQASALATGTEGLSAADFEEKRLWQRGDFKERMLSIFSPLLLLVIWELLVRSTVMDVMFFPAPSSIAEKFREMVVSGELWNHVSASLGRIVVGFLLGGAPGLILGIIMGLSPWIRAAIKPMIGAIYPIPKIAIFPLILVVFGIGEVSKYVIVAVGGFFFFLINTMTGVMNIEKIFLDVGKNFGAGRKEMFLCIALPGALPTIFAGVRLAWGVSLLLIVTAEFVAAKNGLGYLIWHSWQLFAMEEMFVGLITISIVGFISFLLLDELERILIPWKSFHMSA